MSITREELAKHTSEDDCWLAIFDRVYDVSEFKDHPGDFDILVESAGRDSTKEFQDASHSKKAIEDMKDYYIGDLDLDSPEPVKPAKVEEAPAQENWLPISAIIWTVLSFLFLLAAYFFF